MPVQELGGSALPGELGCPTLAHSAAKPVNNKLCLPRTGPCVLQGVGRARGTGGFGGEREAFYIREAALSGGEELEGRCCPRDVGMWGQCVPRNLGCRDHTCPGCRVLFPGPWARCRDGVLIPSPERDGFGCAMRATLSSTPGMLVPYPGLGHPSLLAKGSRGRMGLCSAKPTPIPPKERHPPFPVSSHRNQGVITCPVASTPSSFLRLSSRLGNG